MKKILFKATLALLCTANLMAVNPTDQVTNEVFTPEKVLASGVDSSISTNPYTGESGPARKGTVAATLNNVALLNKYLSENMSSNDAAKVQELSEAINPLIPSLRVVGVFDLFTPEEWLSSKSQPGRVLAAVFYLQKYPQEITPNIRKQLKQIKNQTKIKVLSDSIAKALKGSI